MAQKEADLLSRITYRVEQFLSRYLKIILFSVAGIIVVAGAYLSVHAVTTARRREAEQAFGKVYIAYRQVLDQEEENQQEKLLDLVDSFQVVIDEHPGSVAASKAAYFAGNIHYEAEHYQEALEYYRLGTDTGDNNYSVMLCMQGEATCYEQLEEYERAAETYRALIEKFPHAFLVPKVHYDLGQIYEKLDRLDEAEDEYERITSEFSWSRWSELAEKKLLYLKSTRS